MNRIERTARARKCNDGNGSFSLLVSERVLRKQQRQANNESRFGRVSQQEEGKTCRVRVGHSDPAEYPCQSLQLRFYDTNRIVVRFF
jgi:hypothetical protein